MRDAIRGPLGRRGFQLIGVLVVVFVLAGVALALLDLARQSARSGHWYYQSQMAFDLADGAIKESLFALGRYNSAASAQNAPVLAKIFKWLATGEGSGSSVVLFTSDNPASLPASLESQIQAIQAFSPSVQATVRILENHALSGFPVRGIPSAPGEFSGRLQIVATASAREMAGTRVDRSITVERDFRVVSILPPLLGRFALFVQSPPGQDPNIVRMTIDPVTGQVSYDSGSPKPLVVQAGAKVALVNSGTNILDRTQVASAFTDANFLDKQGWIYLGSDGTSVWKLRLAHGLGDGGETVLLPGERFRSTLGDNGFTSTFVSAMDTVSACQLRMQAPNDGLYFLIHGLASNFELVGLDRALVHTVENPAGSRIALKSLEPGTSACLRLFGAGPDAISPTLVFGPAKRVMVRRASVRLTVDPVRCKLPPGTLELNFLEPRDHGPRFRQVLEQSLGPGPELGTGLVEDAYVRCLNTVLATRPSGEYRITGELDPRSSNPAPVQPPYGSALLPWLGKLPASDSLFGPTLNRLEQGELTSDSLYKGRLAAGLVAFHDALMAKLIYTVKPEAIPRRILIGKVLRVPGIAMIEGGAGLTLGEVDSIAEGGILIAQGPITINGPIHRGAGGELLTLVSTTGDVTLGAGAGVVEAYLVALNGSVKFSGQPLTITGGIACRDFDIEGLKSPAQRTIVYSTDYDPTNVAGVAASLRAYYGGEDRVAVSGAQP